MQTMCSLFALQMVRDKGNFLFTSFFLFEREWDIVSFSHNLGPVLYLLGLPGYLILRNCHMLISSM